MTVCVRCKYSITWSEQRRQFARLMHSGFTIDEAKAAMPRCQVCTTRYMKDRSLFAFRILTFPSSPA
jgi:hypothetical protein